MIKTKTEYRFGKTTLAALVIAIIVFAGGSFFEGATFAEQTMTVAQTTVIRNVTSVSTFTFDSISVQEATVTTTGYTTVTYIGPDMVSISGTARSSGIGTLADLIVFRNTQTSQQFQASVSGGAYSTQIGNHAYYTVSVGYSGSVGGIGSGSCTAGGIVMFSSVQNITADWAC